MHKESPVFMSHKTTTPLLSASASMVLSSLVQLQTMGLAWGKFLVGWTVLLDLSSRGYTVSRELPSHHTATSQA